jgi:hypothetical protein
MQTWQEKENSLLKLGVNVENIDKYKQEQIQKLTELGVPEEKINSTISKSSIEDFSKNPELIDKAKENAGKSKKDRLAALKNASKDDNINNCKPK